MKDLPALSIQQPWPWLIVHGYKDIENRDWKYPPTHRGTFLIHASKKFDWEGYKWVAKNFPEIPLPPDHKTENHHDIQSHFYRGGLVGISYLNDVVTQSDSPWFTGRLGFKLRQSHPINFLPMRGQLSFFPVPKEILEKVEVIR